MDMCGIDYVEELKKTYLSWSLHDSDVRREGIQEAKLEEIAEYTGLQLKTVQQLAEELKAEPVQAH